MVSSSLPRKPNPVEKDKQVTRNIKKKTKKLTYFTRKQLQDLTVAS